MLLGSVSTCFLTYNLTLFAIFHRKKRHSVWILEFNLFLLFFSRINNRISAGEILEHPFIENFALSEAEIALKPIIEVEEPIEEVKQDEAIEVVEEFERMKLPTEILEGNDDTGYHPFDYPSENEMAYGQFRKHPNFQYFQKINFSKYPCTFPLFFIFLIRF